MQVTTNRALAMPLLSVMNFLNEIVQTYPEAVSFAPGRPPERLLDVEGALASLSRYVEFAARRDRRPAADVLRGLGQYSRAGGIIGDLLARFLAKEEGIEVDPRAILVTNGAQEGMSILLQGLFDPARDTLLVSDPAYIGITSAASILGIEIEPIRRGPSGIDLDLLLARLDAIRAAGRTPKALYDIFDFHNPMGGITPLEARRRLLDLAHEQSLLVIEDNPYGTFAYEGERLPTLKSLDRRASVVYVGTFSKTLLPGLRMGYVVADQTVAGAPGVLLADELSKVKSVISVNTSPLLQAMVGGLLLEHDFTLVAANRERLRHYRSNRDRLLARLEHHFAGDELLAGQVTWNCPPGGLFMTMTLPFAFDAARMRTCAEEHGVICCPMSFFSLAPGHERQVRLSFSYLTHEEIDRGVASLDHFVRQTAGTDAQPMMEEWR